MGLRAKSFFEDSYFIFSYYPWKLFSSLSEKLGLIGCKNTSYLFVKNVFMHWFSHCSTEFIKVNYIIKLEGKN